MKKYKVDGNLPTLIIEADNEEEALAKYLEETNAYDIKVEEITEVRI